MVEATTEESLVELAANNNISAFREAVSLGLEVQVTEPWYSRQNFNGISKMVVAERTPLMAAAQYGSLDVMAFLLAMAAHVDVNECSPSDGFTALHCAAQGGSPRAAEAVSMLLSHGANRDIGDLCGRRAFDVISISPKLPHVRSALQRQLRSASSSPVVRALAPQLIISSPADDSPDVPSSPSAAGTSPRSPASGSGALPPGLAELSNSGSSGSSASSGSGSGAGASTGGINSTPSREFPPDPNMPDFKSSVYTSDDFRMYSFKVRPCSRAYSHDWTECPFVHPGENARRRDPRRFQYSCVPCPDFKKGACRRGDACEYAHGVFECWLHPAQYRTRLCKDGTACARRVCFFAHTSDELRPMHIAAGASLSSPSLSSSSLSTLTSPPGIADMRAITGGPDLPPPSPSSVLMLSQFASPAVTPNTPPQPPSPSGAAAKGPMGLQASWAQAASLMMGQDGSSPSALTLPASQLLPGGGSPAGLRKTKSVRASWEAPIPEEGEPTAELMAQLMLTQQALSHRAGLSPAGLAQKQLRLYQQQLMQQQQQHQQQQQQQWQQEMLLQQLQGGGMGTLLPQEHIAGLPRQLSESEVSRLASELAQLSALQQAQMMAAALGSPHGAPGAAVSSMPGVSGSAGSTPRKQVMDAIAESAPSPSAASSAAAAMLFNVSANVSLSAAAAAATSAAAGSIPSGGSGGVSGGPQPTVRSLSPQSLAAAASVQQQQQQLQQQQLQQQQQQLQQQQLQQQQQQLQQQQLQQQQQDSQKMSPLGRPSGSLPGTLSSPSLGPAGRRGSLHLPLAAVAAAADGAGGPSRHSFDAAADALLQQQQAPGSQAPLGQAGASQLQRQTLLQQLQRQMNGQQGPSAMEQGEGGPAQRVQPVFSLGDEGSPGPEDPAIRAYRRGISSPPEGQRRNVASPEGRGQPGEAPWRGGYSPSSPSPPTRSPDWSFSTGSPRWNIPAGPPTNVTSPPGSAGTWSATNSTVSWN